MKILDISVIIPFYNRSDLTITCINSLKRLPLKEILLVDNNSLPDERAAVQSVVKEISNVKMLTYSKKFNYQKINNWAVAQSSGKVIWLLNNDTELPKESEFLVHKMYETAQDPTTGATGCVLLYDDAETIQHAGVYLVPGSTATHLYIREKLKDVLTDISRYPYDITENREFCAVTAASLMIERKKFDIVSGFNENFIVNGGDVDLCLRLKESGYKAILVGQKYGVMLHRESQSVSKITLPLSDFVYSFSRYVKHFIPNNGDGFIDIRELNVANGMINLLSSDLQTIPKARHITKKIGRKILRFLNKIKTKTINVPMPVDDIVYQRFPELLPIYPQLSNLEQKPAVRALCLLSHGEFFGGIATLLFVASKLANELGYDLQTIQTVNFSDYTPLGFLAENGIIIEPERYSTLDASKRKTKSPYFLSIHPDDVFICSAWSDAKILQNIGINNKFVYLIQDYEPIFYANSDRYIWADDTYYSKKFIPLCNTKTLLEYFKQNGYKYVEENAVCFEPPPAPLNQSQKNGPANKKTIFLYARPNIDRNLFFTAIQALDAALDVVLQDERLSNFEWKLYAAGSNDLPSIKLKSGLIIKNKGKMSMREYYAFIHCVDVAISPMLAPHPNYPTLELASLGSHVVTTKWKTKQNLSHYSDHIFMAEANIQDMAEKIIRAIMTDDKKYIDNFGRNNINTDWNQTLNEPIKKVVQKLYDF